MKIKESDIKSLTKDEMKILLSFLMKNRLFTNQMFPYLTFQFFFYFVLVGCSLYFLNSKFNWMIMIENKQTGIRNTIKKVK
jgi:hypothetical protein